MVHGTEAQYNVGVATRSSAGILFYDGFCGLCHGWVRFVLARDRSGDAFRFAPLDSESFRTNVPEENRRGLPDSIVLLTGDGVLLTRSTAIVHILKRLGGAWRYLGIVLSLIPAPLGDWLYDRVASVRHRVFRRPEDACPVLPPHLRSRFDL